MKVDKKTLIITGGGSGIGRELVLAAVQRGAHVAAVDINLDALVETVRLAGDLSDSISTHQVDITDNAAVRSLVQDVRAVHGQLDGVINNAGIIQPFVRVNDLDDAAIDRVMNVNFFGTLHMVRAALPVLLERPEAHIVNVSSMGGFLPVPGQSLYGASKAAVKLLTEGLYAELRDTNVGVTVVFPGATATNITKNSGVESPIDPESEQAKNTPTTPPANVARMIIDAIENKKTRLYTGKDSKLMNMLYRLSPQFATNFIAKQMKDLLR